MLEGRKSKSDRAAKKSRSSSPSVKPKDTTLDDSSVCFPNEDSTMTRKPIRTRRPRIPLIQSGYCAICNLPYNSVEDHVQSKKHQKLIGEDANYIALNGYIHSDVGIESLLSLTGIDAIGFDDFSSPKAKRRNMPRTRASSVVSDIVKTPATPILENEVGHRLRSRKNINYMTPPLDEDSFQEKPDLEPPPPPLEYKEYRELRSSTRALAKLTAVQDPVESEVWDSGRPKRACINRQKRISADERLVSDNKTYYKVEVLSNKLRSSDRDKGNNKQKESKGNGSEKGLIVKFKKLRNSELTQLNNEATNFLFPKKDDSSDEDDEDEEEADDEEEEQQNETEEEIEMIASENNEGSSSSELEEIKPPPQKFKVEEDASMDSTSSSGKKKKKRRSHAEAFIMDNQKYYKFETPGSSSYRLRYHGSYLSPVPTKSNGDYVTKIETKTESKAEKPEVKKDSPERLRVNLDEFKFSFETIPENEKWYKTFRRQDRSEQKYLFTRNYHWDDFVMPYQIPHLKAMDPRMCYNAYKDLLKELQKPIPETTSEEVTSESDTHACDEEVSLSDKNGDKEEQVDLLMEQTDEDSKLSEISIPSACTQEELPVRERRRPGRRRGCVISAPSSGGGRNPRKSPRQHASTLAILSSLIQSRKRRSRNSGISEPAITLQSIPEEPTPKVVEPKPAVTPRKPRKKKEDYFAIAAKIDEELSNAFEGRIDLELEPTTEPDFISFKESRLNVDDIMKMYEESTAKENENSCRRFFNGAPGRKPGKRKKNKTGWPNKVKRRKRVKEGDSESVTGDNGNIESEEDDDDEEEDENGDSDSIIDVEDRESNHDDRENKCDQAIANRVENNIEIRDNILQPYVYVKKLDTCEQSSDIKVVNLPKRTVKRPQRRIKTTSSKSPRMLRRSKGRWYRER